MTIIVCVLFQQKTAYEMRIIDCSSDVCSSYLPWRAAFLVAGCIGVVPALLLFFIREPARPIVAAASVATSFSLGEVARFMWRERAFYGAFYGGISLQTITFYALPAWMPTFMIRLFHVSTDETGVQYGPSVLLIG